MPDKREIKLIKWRDSRGVSAHWNVVSNIKNDGICRMESVGWVIKETDDHICIAPHMGLEQDGDHQVCGEMHIPKVCIEQIKAIKS